MGIEQFGQENSRLHNSQSWPKLTASQSPNKANMPDRCMAILAKTGPPERGTDAG
jgi:hypothetical protein